MTSKPLRASPGMDWSHHTVLVTGAGGFIGSHLTERLVTLGARTRALVRYNSANSWGWLDQSAARDDIHIFSGDIRDRDSLRSAFEGVEIVFHLAALIAIPYSYHAPLSFVRANVEGTVNVLQAALDAGVKLVVHTSTSEVYGTAQYIPIDEAHPLRGQSPYAASKIAADMFVEAFHRSFGLPVATLRPFNTYGPRQSARAVVPAIITQALTQSAVRLGSLAPTRDFSYVLDTVDGFIRVAEHARAVGHVINVGTGREVSVGDLATSILTTVGRDIPIIQDSERVRPEPSEVARLCANIARARDVLRWQPQYPLEEGLALTIDWIRSHLETYRADVYAI